MATVSLSASKPATSRSTRSSSASPSQGRRLRPRCRAPRSVDKALDGPARRDGRRDRATWATRTRSPSSSSLGAITAPLIVAVGVGKAPDGGQAADVRRRRCCAGPRVPPPARWPAPRRSGSALPADDAAALAAVAEGALLGAYAFPRYRVGHAPTSQGRRSTAFTVVTGAARRPAQGARSRRAANASPTPCTSPATWSTPRRSTCPRRASPTRRVEAAPRRPGSTVEVLDEKALKKRRLRRHPRRRPGLVAPAAAGAARPTRRPQAKPHLALVGKGITFDSGGLSLKPPAAMEG